MKRDFLVLFSANHGFQILLTVIACALASVYLANHDNVLIESIDSVETRAGKYASGGKEYNTFVAAVIAMGTAWTWVLCFMIPWPWFVDKTEIEGKRQRWVWVSLVPVLVIAIIATVRNARPNINMDSAGETGWGGNLYIAALFWMYLLLVVATSAVLYFKLLSTKKYIKAILAALCTGGGMWGTVEGLKRSRKTATSGAW
jgi:hypothetical protein